MKNLTIQIHPPFDVEKMRTIRIIVHRFGGVQVDKGGDYLKLRFETDDIEQLWWCLESKMENIKSQCIVVCEGDHGWDDYLLLHHYDPEEPLDALP